MAQHDYVIANQSGAAFRADLNNALAAIVSQNSGAAEPSTTYAYMPWADTSNGLFKIRNAANNNWITLYQLDGEWDTIALEDGTALAPALYFKDSGTDTGIYSPAADNFAITTAGVERVNFKGATEVVFNDGGADVDFRIEGDTEPNLFKIDAGTDQVQVANLNGGSLAGTRNRIINGDMRIDQRNAGAAQSLAPGVNYTVDRWLVNATGGTVTGQQVTGASANQFRYQITGAAGVTNVVFAQRIEATNSADLAGKTVTLSVDLSNSVLTTVDWQLQYANATNNFSGVTSIATGSWTVSNSVNRYSTQISIPVAAVTGLQVVVAVGAQTSGTWTIGDVQLEAGSVATPFERRSYGQELALCQRYFQNHDISVILDQINYALGYKVNYYVPMRATPTITPTGSLYYTDITTGAKTGTYLDSNIDAASKAYARHNNAGFVFIVNKTSTGTWERVEYAETYTMSAEL